MLGPWRSWSAEWKWKGSNRQDWSIWKLLGMLLTWCSSMLSVAAMNAIIKSLIWLTGYSSSLREAKAGAWSRSHGVVLLTGFLLGSCPAHLSCTAHAYLPSNGVIHNGLGLLPTSINNEENVPGTWDVPPVQSQEAVLQLGFPLSKCVGLTTKLSRQTWDVHCSSMLISV